MRLSQQRIQKLQALLKELSGHDYTTEEAQSAGAAIMHFIVAKQRRINSLTNNKERDNGKTINKGSKDSSNQ